MATKKFSFKEVNAFFDVIHALHKEAQALYPKDVVSISFDGTWLNVVRGENEVKSFLCSEVNDFIEKRQAGLLFAEASISAFKKALDQNLWK